MLRIYKYSLPLVDDYYLEIPGGKEILSVIEQNNGIMVYATVGDYRENAARYDFKILRTGMEFDASFLFEYIFLGTIKLYSGELIFHVLYKEC